MTDRSRNIGPAARSAVIMDLSPLRKFEVTGPDAEALLQYALTRNVRKLAIGQVVYTAMCYEHGGMIDDGTLFRLGENNFRWIGGDDYSGIWLREQAEKLGLKALGALIDRPAAQYRRAGAEKPRHPAPRSSGRRRRSPRWPSSAGSASPSVASADSTACRSWCRAPAIPASSATRSSAIRKDALTVFDAVWEAGEPHGLMPLGLEALDMVRIEAGLIFAGYEFCDQTDPFEAGIGFTVPLNRKNEDFIGREALIRRKEHPHTEACRPRDGRR